MFKNNILSCFLVYTILFHNGGICQNYPEQTFDQYYDIVGEYFGENVIITDDINGDDIDDFIISQKDGFNSEYENTGRVYIYYGTENIYNKKICDVLLTGNETDEDFGVSLESFDINGDNFSDVIVGSNGKVSIFLGGINFDDVPEIIITGESEDDEFGKSLSFAGDVNGDGYYDLLVGAYGNNISGNSTGRVYLYYGGENIDNIPDKTFIGSYYRTIGSNVGCAGDLNNDGFDDIIITALQYEIEGMIGYVQILYGGSDMNSTIDFTLSTGSTSDYFGRLAIESLGDINNDGCGEIFIGCASKSYVYYGGENMSNTPNYQLNQRGSDVSYNADLNLDGINDLVISNNSDVSIYFGENIFDNEPDLVLQDKGSITSLGGDINNDGYTDLIIGGKWRNVVYVYFGSADIGEEFDIFLSTQESHSFFGSAISASGDFNNDGLNDIIIGAPGQYFLSEKVGAVYIFSGESIYDDNPKPDRVIFGSDYGFAKSLTYIGDINNDGYDDIIIGSHFEDNGIGGAYVVFGGKTIDIYDYRKLIGGEQYLNYGTYVSTAGDFNNDGFNDFMVSSYKHVDLYLGGSDFDTNPDLVISLDEDHYWPTISGGNDLNNDGYDDIIVGDYEIWEGSGKAMIFYGGDNLNNNPDVILNGKSVDERFGSVIDFTGDINNDGFKDILISTKNAVKLYYGGLPMDTIPDLVIKNYGTLIAGINDYNNDGFDDFIIINSSENYMAYIFLGGLLLDATPDILIPNITNTNYSKSICPFGDYNKDGYDDFLIGSQGSELLGAYMGQVYLYAGNANMTINNEPENNVNEFKLYQNYPNPFNLTTSISYDIPITTNVLLNIYDIHGHLISTLVNQRQSAGIYKVQWNTSSLSSGIYFYRIQTEEHSKVMKSILVK